MSYSVVGSTASKGSPICLRFYPGDEKTPQSMTAGCGMLSQLGLLDLAELQLYRGRAAEDQDRNLDPTLLVVDLFDDAVEIGERTIDDAYHFARLEERLRLRLVAAIGNTTKDGLGLLLGDRRRLVGGTADEAHDARGVLDQVPGRLVHFHLNQHVTRKELALALALLAVAHFHHFFGGHENLAELLFHPGQLDALDQRAHDMLLVSRVGMHHVPTLSHRAPLTNNQRNEPTQQGVNSPEDQGHHQHHRDNDQRGNGGLLTGRPHDFADRHASVLKQWEERTALDGLQSHQARHHRQHEQREDAVQNRLAGKDLIADDADSDQSHDEQPLDQVEARGLIFGLCVHARGIL